MPAMMTDSALEAPHLLTILHQHAIVHGDATCHLLPDRVITYRRFWARIERASARLQGEWGIAQNDTVAYVGQGHPDALVLYFALLRIGARLLPLERPGLPQEDAILLHRPALVLYDDVRPDIDLPSSPLHGLLALWCTHDPYPLIDDVLSPSLWLVVDDQWRAFCLEELCTVMADSPRTARVGSALFTQQVLCELILPSLYLARPLQFERTTFTLR